MNLIKTMFLAVTLTIFTQMATNAGIVTGPNGVAQTAVTASNLVGGLGTNLTRISMLSAFYDTNYVGRVLSSQIDVPYGSQINFEAGQIITPYREFGTNNYYVSGCTNSNYNGRYKIYYWTNDVNVGPFTVYTNLNGLSEMWTSIQGEAGTTFLCEDTVLTTNNAPIPNGTSPTTIPCVFDGHNSLIGPGHGSTYWYTDVGGTPTGGLQPLMVGSFETNFTAVAIGNLVFGSAGNIIGSETVGNNFGLTLANGATVFSNSIVIANGSITGNGRNVTNIPVTGINFGKNSVIAAVTVGGSPFTFSNNTGVPLEAYMTDAAAYSVNKNGATVYASLAVDAYLLLQPTNTLTLTYASTTPTLRTNAW